MKKKAIIIGIKGLKLNRIEKKILSKEHPWGVILFERNIKNFNQTKKLISSIRTYTKDVKFPILIDEEGNRVTRLKNLINNVIPQKLFGDIFLKNKEFSKKILIQYLKSVIKNLKDLGFNINTVPVLDILYKKSHNIIGDRSFSDRSKIINELGNIYLDTYKKNRFGTVMKHIPGHGLSLTDSHKRLPIIKKKLSYLIKYDFSCFKKKKSFFAMTGHLLFSEIDRNNCVTHSKKIIKKIIREKIGFKGILISDDISMKALKFDPLQNGIKALKSGCNLVLYCEPSPLKSLQLVRKLPYVDKFTQKKTSQFYKFLR